MLKIAGSRCQCQCNPWWYSLWPRRCAGRAWRCSPCRPTCCCWGPSGSRDPRGSGGTGGLRTPRTDSGPASVSASCIAERSDIVILLWEYYYKNIIIILWEYYNNACQLPVWPVPRPPGQSPVWGSDWQWTRSPQHCWDPPLSHTGPEDWWPGDL